MPTRVVGLPIESHFLSPPEPFPELAIPTRPVSVSRFNRSSSDFMSEAC